MLFLSFSNKSKSFAIIKLHTPKRLLSFAGRSAYTFYINYTYIGI